MRPTSRVAMAPILVGLAGLAWFWLELTPPRLGFDDTDSPEVSLRFLHAHPEVHQMAGAALFVLAAALVVTVLVMAERLAAADGPSRILTRSLTTIGIVSAACFFLHGILRFAAEPILYIDDLDHAWGASAYLAVQMIGVHGVEQGGVFALCAWIVGVSVAGVRAKAVPLALGLLAVVPAFRLAGLLIGPFLTLPDVMWIFAIGAIPVSLAWCVLLGVELLRRPVNSAAGAT